ncbi:hypothetical protein HUG20_11055 [Salicibibacter cibi]|uniref:Uncharacterized protein n=1 Tax=Salicibibacter cibi TaxID=2743001 RepID=A0A7T6ZBI5_9BACI|nr:hypothetical protein [Salicibibacter cibi]QQK80376.1 hypothetical protein HUG20_11055 [Salicibibacter cibi]
MLVLLIFISINEREEAPISAPHHNEAFDIDEKVLAPTVNLLERIANRELKGS